MPSGLAFQTAAAAATLATMLHDWAMKAKPNDP